MWRTLTLLFGTIGLVLTAAGCGTDHRISVAQFLDLQNRYANQQAERVPQSAPPEVDLGWEPYRVGPGDTLVVTLTGLDAAVVPTLTVTINRQGEIDMPLVGKLSVLDMQIQDVEATIKAAHVPSKVRDLVVHVSVADYNTTDVTVVGAVSTPGIVPLLRSQRNLLFAILGAGGVSQFSSGRVKLQRLRRPLEEVRLDLLDPVELQAALTLEPLEDGDIVTVEPEPNNTVYVGGLVNAPAPQIYPAGTHVNILQALASAGGLRTDVFPKEGTLIRQMPDGRDVQVKLDLTSIGNGKAENLVLASGDILWVPHTWETRVQDFINRNFFLRAGFSATVSYNVSGIEYMNRQTQQSAQTTGGGSSFDTQNTFDPFGFLNQNAALQNLQP